jgi:VWFA-related protein
MFEQRNTKRFFVLLSAVILYGFVISPPPPANGQQQTAADHEALEYEISVRAQLVPLFVVDNAGNPVYNLKQEELELYVDGKPFDIIFFNSFRLEVEETDEQSQAKRKIRVPERINFIIIDSLVGNMNTLGPSRVIAAQIIKRATTGDAFVILESNQISGFQYVAGPAKDKMILMDALKGIEKRFQQRNLRQSFLRRQAGSTMGSGAGASDLVGSLNAIAENKRHREREQYEKDIKLFAHSLEQLKYALRSTTLPKTVYLISASGSSRALGTRSVTYFRFLENAAKAVNYGGSLFYLINPMRQKERGSGSDLKFMADAAGGTFISGTNLDDIVDQVKKSTSAYYEVAFIPSAKAGEKSVIQLKCKRKDLHLTTIAYSERERPYKEMKPIEKKLFVLNVVNGGNWSRMMGPVKRVEHKVLHSESVANGRISVKDIEIPIPVIMQHRQLHLYRVAVDIHTQKAELRLFERVSGKKEILRFNIREGKKHFFVIIEPSRPISIFNRVI